MIRSFSCHHFRNLSVEKLPLRRINLLIGPNGSGKSSFIRALTLCSAVRGDEESGSEEVLRIMQSNGRGRSLRAGKYPDTPISFRWGMSDGADFRLSCVAGERPEDFGIIRERAPGNERTDPLYELTDERFRVCSVSSSTISIETVRGQQRQTHFYRYLEREGEDLIGLFRLFESGREGRKWKQEIVSSMRELIHDLRDMDIVSVSGQDRIRFEIGKGTFDLSEVSEGTIRGLALNLLIHAPLDQSCALLTIDDPETGLHPAWMKVIGEWIRDSNRFGQCVISTHSPDFLDLFTREILEKEDVELLVFSADGRIHRLTGQDLCGEIGDWELGDLYRTGDPLLGGWPW